MATTSPTKRMKTQSKPRKPAKILFSLWDNLVEPLNRRLEESCLRRDAFLDAVLTHELVQLEQEISKPNSPEAKKCIADHLAMLTRKPVTLALRPETVRRLEEVCKKKNIVRDAYMNRLVLCLLAPPKLLNRLFGLKDYTSEVLKHWEPPGFDSYWQSLRTIPELIRDPFQFVRECIALQQIEDDEVSNFYMAVIPENLFGVSRGKKSGGEPALPPNTLGLNVYLPDERVPGHPANVELNARLEAILEDLGLPTEGRG